MSTDTKEVRKRSIYMPQSLLGAVQQAAEALDLTTSDTLGELCRRGLLVGCPIRPSGQRTPLGLAIDEVAQVVSLYEDTALAEAMESFRQRYRINSYSALVRVLTFAGLYAYNESMEKETPHAEG